MAAVRHRITAGLIIGSALGFGTLVATSQAAHASAPAAQAAAHKATAQANPVPPGYRSRNYNRFAPRYNRFAPRYYNRYYPRYRGYSDCCDPCADYVPYYDC